MRTASAGHVDEICSKEEPQYKNAMSAGISKDRNTGVLQLTEQHQVDGCEHNNDNPAPHTQHATETKDE